jgi:hypothetical protein
MASMTRDEREAFLADVHVGVVRVTGPVHGFGEPDTRVVAFTAAQIPHIADRVYPATLADVLAPHLTRWSAR